MSGTKATTQAVEVDLPAVSAMKRPELEEELMTYGVLVTKGQLVPELRVLLTETRTRKGITRARKSKEAMIPALSGLSKGQLQERAKASGVPDFDPTWTIGKLQSVIRETEMARLVPKPTDKLKFGKHQGEMYYRVRRDNMTYCDWVLEQEAQNTNPDFAHFCRYLKGPMGEDPDWNLVGASSSSGRLTSVKMEEPDPEVSKLKKELEEMKQELRAQSQTKRAARDDAVAMPVDPAVTKDDLAEMVSVIKNLAGRMEQLEKK